MVIQNAGLRTITVEKQINKQTKTKKTTTTTKKKNQPAFLFCSFVILQTSRSTLTLPKGLNSVFDFFYMDFPLSHAQLFLGIYVPQVRLRRRGESKASGPNLNPRKYKQSHSPTVVHGEGVGPPLGFRYVTIF